MNKKTSIYLILIALLAISIVFAVSTTFSCSNCGSENLSSATDADITALNSTIAELEAKIAELESAASDSDAAIAGYEKKIEELEATIDGLEYQIEELTKPKTGGGGGGGSNDDNLGSWTEGWD